MIKKYKKLFITSLIFSQVFLTNTLTSHADSIILNKSTTDGVNVRAKEDMNSEILGGIEDFTMYEIKGESANWYEIEFEDKKGFVGKDWFFRLDHTSLIEASDFKEKPDKDSKNLKENKLQAKTKVTILEFDEDSDYVKISYDDKFKDNKELNNINLEKIENNSLLFDLSDSESVVKTVTLGSSKDDRQIPEVVTLSDTPATVAMDDEFEENLSYDGPIEGYVKLSSLAISSKDSKDLDDIRKFYKDMNTYIEEKLAQEEALANQVREIQTTQYITTTSLENTQSSSSTTNTNTVMVPVAGSEVGVDLYKWATQFVGRPYVFGGTSLTNGIDCSGFTMRIYEQAGIGLPHFAQSQQRYGVEIPYGSEQAGDLVFYGSSLNNITHVGMADGHGNMIHASSPRVGIIISPIRNPISIKRIIQ